MLVEMKNGETYDGHLVNCGTWMNIHLREVIRTSKDGQVLASAPDEIGSQLVGEVERRLVPGRLKALGLAKRMVVKAWAVAGAGVDLGVKVVEVEVEAVDVADASLRSRYAIFRGSCLTIL